MTRKIISKAVLGAAVAAMTAATLAPASALAQPGYYNGDDQTYRECRQNRNDRAVGGAVIGGILGAVIGSNVADRGVRTEGAILGGAVGAAAGAGIGSSTAACDDDPYRTGYNGSGYNDGYYANGYGRGYRGNGGYRARGGNRGGGYGYNGGGYNNGGYDNGYNYRSNAYYGGGSSYNAGYGDGYGTAATRECRSTETRTYDRYGRIQVRTVQVCQDAYGNWSQAY